MNPQTAKFISSIPNIIYLTNLSFFSENEREVFLIITKNKKFIITDKRYSDAVRKYAKDFILIESGAMNFITNEAKSFFEKLNIKILEFEENNLTVFEYKKLIKTVKMIPLEIDTLRLIKNENEINSIRKACGIADSAFEYILTKIKIGVSEKQIAEELIDYFRKSHADYSFRPIVAFGKNSTVPHHEPTNKKLTENQIVLMDFGVKINNYCSDMTRTVFFGKADEKFKNIYTTVLQAQKNAIENIKLGQKTSIIDLAARNHIKKHFEDIPHSVGHGIGLEVHEAPNISPNSKDKVQNGMIFSIEPGIYIRRYGGVRIEDLVLVRSGKAELISKAKRGIIAINAK